MSPDSWIAFAAASAILLAVPGPTILLVVSYSLGHGRRLALPLIAGVALGDFIAMTASMLGLGALLAVSATLFTVLKWIGALYLIYLGVRLFRAEVPAEPESADPGDDPLRVAAHAFAVTALNPKSIVFFVAFLPQFLAKDQSYLPQMAVMEATFLALAALNAAAYAFAAAGARSAISRPGMRRMVNRAGGSLLIGAGVLTLAWRRSAA